MVTTTSSTSPTSTPTLKATWSQSSATSPSPTRPPAGRASMADQAASGMNGSSPSLPRGRQVDFTRLSSPARWRPGFAVPYNQRMIGQKVLITNDLGDWLLLTEQEFREFVEGRPRR